MRRQWGKELRVAYTTVDRLTLVKCELEEYFMSKMPDIMGVAETKLSD